MDSSAIDIFNVNEFKRQTTEFSAWIYSNNLNIVLVSETNFANYELFNVNRTCRVNNNHFRGDTSIYVNREFNVTSNNILF